MCEKVAGMRYSLLLTLLLAGALHGENWNHSWEVRRGGEADWQTCHLPHSEAIPYFLGSEFRCGVVEYRKELVVPEEWRGKHLFLEFEAAFQDATVLVDGHEVGRHRGGYTSFRVELTPRATPGRHVITVRVDNSWQPTLAPRAGEHVFAAGIYRDVRLLVLPPVHAAHRGLCVTTPELSRERARVVVEAELVNRSGEPRRVQLAAALRGADVEATGEPCILPPHSCRKLRLELPPLINPQLWHPDSPHLYQLDVRLLAEGQEPQRESVELGLRWFEWRAEEGFFLNGQHLFLLGANVHQGIAGWGDAATNASHERDVRLMKEAGFNFIRGSHYPHDPAFLQACDRLGMLYWSEGGIWGMGGAKEGNERWNAPAIPAGEQEQAAFEAGAAQQLREMVRDARNHPCVIVWSVCNEPFFLPAERLPRLRRMLSNLVDVVRAEDPTRPVAIGGAQRGQIDRLGDIAGYNGDGARLFTAPGVPCMVSEYGSASELAPGSYAPHFGDFANERPAWRAGAAIWCGFDHGSIWESGQYMGIADFFRRPKRSWYWYRRELRGLEPPAPPRVGEAAAIRLASDRTALSSCKGEDDALICFQLLDREGQPVEAGNPVTLTVSGPGVFPTGKSIRFAPDSPIRMTAGAGAISFRSAHSGSACITASSPGLAPAQLFIDCRDPDPALAYDPQRSREQLSSPPADRGPEAASSPPPTVELATNRPCRASSAEAQAPLASDGDSISAWHASGDDTAPWLQLDLEFCFRIGQVEVRGTLPQRIRCSTDAQHWSDFRPGMQARYIRLDFPPGARVSTVSVTP